MIPLRDDNPTLEKPMATYILIGINVVVWVFFQQMGQGLRMLESIYQLGIIPAELLSNVEPGSRLQVPGTGHTYITGPSNWFSLFSSMFSHGGWMHLIGNMWFLYIFGDNVEDAMGREKFIGFYLLCGLAAAFAQVFSNPGSTVPMIGASGAIGGVMGAYAFLYPRAPVHLLIPFGFYWTKIVVPAIFMLGYWFLLQILEGILTMGRTSGGVAFWAHAGGFIAGIVLMNVFINRQRLERIRAQQGSVNQIISRASRGSGRFDRWY